MRFFLAIFISFTLSLMLMQNLYSQEHIEKEVFAIGDFGTDVSEIQLRLIELDYENVDPTGLFGIETVEAVKSFQQKNDIEISGIVDSETYNKLFTVDENLDDETVDIITINESELLVLAKIIHSEARGEPFEGQVAVGAVVVNRINSPSFPNTVSGVVFEPLAFTAVADGQYYLDPNEEAFRAARDALKGIDPSNGALYYYNPAKVTSNWIWSRPVITRIGKHTFAR
ncbi:MAG: spore cortex-lytic enzyme [Bacillota bacterium]|nr:spore cortex-lytic enzyme [Bacillota bacterium]